MLVFQFKDSLLLEILNKKLKIIPCLLKRLTIYKLNDFSETMYYNKYILNKIKGLLKKIYNILNKH